VSIQTMIKERGYEVIKENTDAVVNNISQEAEL
jgi:hypothetical protein